MCEDKINLVIVIAIITISSLLSRDTYYSLQNFLDTWTFVLKSILFIPVCSDAVTSCEECNAGDGNCTKCTSPKVLEANACIGKINFDMYNMESIYNII